MKIRIILHILNMAFLTWIVIFTRNNINNNSNTSLDLVLLLLAAVLAMWGGLDCGKHLLIKFNEQKRTKSLGG